MSEKGKYTYNYPRPMVAADTVLFRVVDESILVLLIKRGKPPYERHWALPGGFLDINETLATAAARELHEETGVDRIILEQFGVFDDPERDTRGRTISVAFIGMICGKCPEAKAADDAADARWHDINELPQLAFDHNRIISAALDWLASRLGLTTEEPRGFLILSSNEQNLLRGLLAEHTKLAGGIF